jgi:protein N-terminal methyltransferase
LVDCGAGIGRVSKVFLLPTFQSVDLVEQDPAFLKTAETEYLKEFGDRVQKYICQGLQDFVPEAGRYEAIWAQWCLGHLTDCGF